MSGTPDGLPRLYTPAEVAEALRCSTWWVQEQVRRHRFPYEAIAGGCRFTVEQYVTILRLCQVLPAGDVSADPPVNPVAPDVPASVGLRARVPRRLRGVTSIDSAA